jgi:hypothetical protein
LDEETGLYMIDYGRMTPVLWAHDKMLLERIEKLESFVDNEGDLAQKNEDGVVEKITASEVEADTGILQRLTVLVEAIFEKITAKTVDVLGTLTAKLIKTERIEADQIVLDGKVLADGESTGEATIKAGETAVNINDHEANPESKIFITPLGSTDGQLLFVSKKANGSFEISIDVPLNYDLKFDYWVVN